MTTIHSASRSTAAHPSTRPAHAPALTKRPLPAAVAAAAKDLLAKSEGNDVSIARYKTSPAQLTAFSSHAAAFKDFLFKTGMHISKEIPESDFAKHSVTKLTAAHVGKAIFDFAQVPESVPETPVSRATQAKARADANVLAQVVHKNGGDLYVINWNNQDDTDVNIVAAVNKRSGELTFVKLFPAI